MKEIKTFEDWNDLLIKKDKSEDDFLLIAQVYEEGLIRENNLEIKESFEKAFETYLEGSHYNYCKIRVANYLSEGIGCKKDINKSIELYNELIKENLSTAAFNLSTIYRDKGDYAKVVELLYKVFEIDNIFPIELAFHYLFGLGIKKDKLKAKEIFLSIINQSKKYSVYEIEQANYQLGLLSLENNEIQNARFLLSQNNNEISNDLLNIIGR
ncbi:sel1 repeat family protein [Flavobacterium sp. I3-2]|uniref:sel1 repeat family protein n=1 Tax=Flavobacterium sp. I3-2 TaxID=2748319 RepID=UPI0015B02D44|nr:sel1 repeat family protein [Flavobacterium sp. I3-2]